MGATLKAGGVVISAQTMRPKHPIATKFKGRLLLLPRGRREQLDADAGRNDRMKKTPCETRTVTVKKREDVRAQIEHVPRMRNEAKAATFDYIRTLYNPL